MADVKLKDNLGEEQIYEGVESVALPRADGEGTVEFVLPPTLQEKAVTITENGTTEITGDEGYAGLSKVSVTANVDGGGSLDPDDVYTKDQVDGLFRSSRADYDENDAGNPSFIQNRPFYDFSESAVYEIGSAGLETITDGENTWIKISDVPICENSDLLQMIPAGAEKGQPAFNASLEQTVVTLETGSESYALVLNVTGSILAQALSGYSTKKQVLGDWGVYTAFVDSSTGQTKVDDDVDFSVDLLFAQAGTERAYDADGKLVSFGAGTYLMFDGGTKAQITSGTITVSYGGVKKLDPTNINLSNYCTKPEVQALVTTVLPPFTAEDEGKVLGIKNGQLAWVSVAAMNDELYLQQAYAVEEDGTDGIWIDGAEVQNG